ncbi:bifunctional phosphoribosylaminoimidazolecarboxamide formyltransferase/IMP cyclohydrolase [bacterium]|nr:bifunctional phosphoribosylaminoimidazolecarboxamide formyltransferase/IMP cyclohydrolase [bacterium]
MQSIKRALISVYDKTSLLELARVLVEHNIEIIATGGTSRVLQENGFQITSIEKVTGFPEVLEGRVKTLHPKIFGGLLARRDLPAHLAETAAQGIALIDLVVVNLYPFRETISRPQTTLEEALENIDIGGVALMRAAAKNFTAIAVLTHPSQYAAFCEELRKHNGGLTETTRRQLALGAFACTAAYDATIHAYLQRTAERADLPASLLFALEKQQDLRYGENPHQRAGFYRDSLSPASGFLSSRQLQGKELSYNNIADADAALNLVRLFQEPCCVIIKHANPCGVAVGDSLAAAYENAKATDPASAFGGIVGFNREVDGETATRVAELFTEVIIAPAFSTEAQRIFAGKKNLRLLEMEGIRTPAPAALEFKAVAGGVLVQEQDVNAEEDSRFKIVTQRRPTQPEWQALRFAWKVVRLVKSNAVIYCGPDRTLGIGAGQMSRVDAAIIAVEKAKRAGLSVQGAAVASDAFFPFADSVEEAARAGATAIIQPGGSLRDAEVIAAADRHQLAMAFTGIRHFRH